MLVVNYFGVLTAGRRGRARRSSGPGRRRRHTGVSSARRGPTTWSFNSARKFFGVPDGGFLYGPGTGRRRPAAERRRRLRSPADAAGRRRRRAWDQFKRHEDRIGIEPRAMSVMSARLLEAPSTWVVRAAAATSNFETVHRQLGPLNTIELSLDAVASDGPMCYPFLPASDVDRDALGRLGVFVPRLWPEIESRREPSFEWERLVARRLLPLPIDHRYGPCEMEKLCQTLLQVLP